MRFVPAWIAPLALMLPAMGAVRAELARPAALTPSPAAPVPVGPVSHPLSGIAAPDDAAAAPWQGETAAQVRIEQHITIRIGPARAPAATPFAPAALAEMDAPVASVAEPKVIERKFGKCVAAGGIAGSQPGPGNRLILYLRDSRVLSAVLDKACSPRDFYSGFLVRGTRDGMICAGRDPLLARSGANCRVHGFRQLIEVP